VSRRISELLVAPPRAGTLPRYVVSRAGELERAAPDLGVSGSDAPVVLGAVRDGVARCLGLARIPRARDAAWQPRSAIGGDGYTIEIGLYEAVPGLVVPAHVYRPDGAGPFPGVVHTPGHWMENARLEPDIQRFNIRLARAGLVVLCLDPVGQGERRTGWHEHGQLAPLLAGFTTLGVMVVETMAALGILAGRLDVDAARLGVTGASGGGFVSTFVAALDDRVAAAAICCILNTHVGQLRDAALGTGWDGWVDLCNQVPRLAATAPMGLVVGAAAPRHLTIVHAVDDPPFPIEGVRAVVAQAATAYAATGVPDRLALVEVAGGHGLHLATRAAAAGGLARALGASDLGSESPAMLLEHPYLVTHDQSRAGTERAQTHIRAVGRLAGESLSRNADTNPVLVELARSVAAGLRARTRPDRDAIARTLGIDTNAGAVRAVVSNHLTLDVGFAQRLAIESGEVTLDAVLLLPERFEDGAAGVLIAVDEGGKGVALDSPAVAVARACGWAVLAVDLSGTGESAASEFELATACWMLDGDLLALRVRDLRLAVEWLSVRYSTGQQIDKSRIAVWGSEAFGLVALLAAAVDPRIAGVACGPFVESLEELLAVDSRTTPMAYTFAALAIYDLADLVQLVLPRPALIAPASGEPAQLVAALLTEMERA
jgi:cephalosporin-C deacetylase-like acetyl esterase